MSATTAAAARSGSKRPMGLLRLTLVLGALEAFGPLSMDVYMPQLPQLAAQLRTSDALAQATMSVCMIGLGVGQLVAGPLSDRFGRKRPLAIGVASFALLSVLCAIAPSIELLLVARFLQGLAGSAGVVISLAVARDLFQGVALSRMLSMLAIVTASTPIVAPVLGGQLARFMDWRGIFFVLGGIGVALLAVAVFGLRETLPPERRHSDGFVGGTASHMSEVLRDPLFTAILAASCLGGLSFFSYLSMSSFVLQDEFEITPQVFSLLFAVNALANLAGSQISRLLVGRLGPTRVYLTGQISTGLVGAALLVATLLGLPVPVYLVLLALFLCAIGLGGPNGTTLALSGHGRHAGTASALLGTSMFTVGALLVPVVSALFGTSALTMAATVLAGSGTAALIGVLFVRRLAPAEFGRPVRS